MEKIDLKKDLKQLYDPGSREVGIVDIPEMSFIRIDGMGSPESTAFQQSIEALYPVAYSIKFSLKKAGKMDFTVMPLEGLWWSDNPADFVPGTGNRDRWQWTLMIMQPGFISSQDYEAAVKSTREKKDLPLLEKVRFESFKEGKSVQIMHIGPFSTEGANIHKLHAKITEIGGKISGKHHEIYLSDFRKIDPLKMKTILRQPFRME